MINYIVQLIRDIKRHVFLHGLIIFSLFIMNFIKVYIYPFSATFTQIVKEPLESETETELNTQVQ